MPGPIASPEMWNPSRPALTALLALTLASLVGCSTRYVVRETRTGRGGVGTETVLDDYDPESSLEQQVTLMAASDRGSLIECHRHCRIFLAAWPDHPDAVGVLRRAAWSVLLTYERGGSATSLAREDRNLEALRHAAKLFSRLERRAASEDAELSEEARVAGRVLAEGPRDREPFEELIEMARRWQRAEVTGGGDRESARRAARSLWQGHREWCEGLEVERLAPFSW